MGLPEYSFFSLTAEETRQRKKRKKKNNQHDIIPRHRRLSTSSTSSTSTSSTSSSSIHRCCCYILHYILSLTHTNTHTHARRTDALIMSSLFRRKLSCFYCGHQVSVQTLRGAHQYPNGRLRRFNCPDCSADNHLDEVCIPPSSSSSLSSPPSSPSPSFLLPLPLSFPC